MGKRMRRFTATVDGTPITGCRDLSENDQSEYNRDKGDDEPVGDEVRMTEGPFDITFEMLASDSAVVSGYVGAFVAVGKEITRNPTDETVEDKTYTYDQGHFNVGHDLNTDNPGRVKVTGNFKTRTIT